MQERIFFKSPEHRSRFVSAMQQIGKYDIIGSKLDPEYTAAIYILTSDEATWKKASDYVSDRGILFEELLDEIDFSSGYRILVQLAGNLFNGNQHVDPLEFVRLDEGNFAVALTAIKLRRHGASRDDFKA